MNYFIAGFEMAPSFLDWMQHCSEGDNFNPNNPNNPGAQIRDIYKMLGLDAVPGVNSVYIVGIPL